jgi:hypothetical protein
MSEHFQIKHRWWTGAVLFEGQFDTMRLCVEAAAKAGSNLSGADLGGSNLSGSNLCGSNLGGSNLRGSNLSGAIIRPGVTLNRAPVRRATRSDGYEFFLLDTSAGWRALAGCRFFEMDEARHHWEQTRGGTAIGDESLDILTMFELAIEREAGR